MAGFRVSFAILMIVLNALCHAQITFSKDWNAGKRSPREYFIPHKPTLEMCQAVLSKCVLRYGREIHKVPSSNEILWKNFVDAWRMRKINTDQ